MHLPSAVYGPLAAVILFYVVANRLHRRAMDGAAILFLAGAAGLTGWLGWWAEGEGFRWAAVAFAATAAVMGINVCQLVRVWWLR